jgi:hypothetical protein
LALSKGPGRTKTAEATSIRDPDSEDVTSVDLDDEPEGSSYWNYLEWIQSGAIGFFKLHGDIYVAKGWDERRKAAKVRVDSNLLSLDVLICEFRYRIIGTTCIAPTWVRNWQSYAFAQQSIHSANAFI